MIIRQVFSRDYSDFLLFMFKELQVKMAEEMCMAATVQAGSDEDRVNDSISKADNDDAANDGGHLSGNAQPHHTSWSIGRKICITVVVTVIAAAIAAVLIHRHLVNI